MRSPAVFGHARMRARLHTVQWAILKSWSFPYGEHEAANPDTYPVATFSFPVGLVTNLVV